MFCRFIECDKVIVQCRTINLISSKGMGFPDWHPLRRPVILNSPINTDSAKFVCGPLDRGLKVIKVFCHYVALLEDSKNSIYFE